MAEKSIFKCGKKELLELKEILKKYYEYQKKIEEIVKKEQKQLQFNEERKKEIEQAIISREAELKKEIEKPFDAAISRYINRKEEILSHKKEKRNQAIEIHIEQEKQDIGHEGSHYKKEVRKIIKEEGLPSICMNKLFLSLFCPRMLSDAIVLIAFLVVVLLILPLSIFYFGFSDGGRLELTTIYLFIIVFIFILYTLVNTLIKDKHMAAFERINECRTDVDSTAKEIREIIQRVREMSDEELICDAYTQEYITEVNQELEMLDAQILEETAKKDAAIRAFEENTTAKADREQKFRDLYQKEMKRRADILTEIRATKEIEEKNLAIIDQLMEKFKPLQEFGIDIFNEDMIDELLGYLRSREAKTIGGAIEQRNKTTK